MKKLSSRMKIMLVLAVSAAMIIPSVASAGEISNTLVKEMKLTKGKYTVPGKYVRSSGSLKFNENSTKVEFVVVNGNSSGKNRVSSVKIDLLDGNGKKKAVAISPALFNQNVSNGIGTLYEDDLKGLTELNLEIQVGGPKDGFIVLNITEYYEDEECPDYDPKWPNCE